MNIVYRRKIKEEEIKKNRRNKRIEEEEITSYTLKGLIG